MADWLQGLEVGQWYVSEGTRFEIVGIDVDQEVVLIQHFDGALEEFDFASWLDLKARSCAAPEDWSGALDLEREDYGVDPDQVQPECWDGWLDRFERFDDRLN